MRYWILTSQASPLAGGGIGTYVEEMSDALTARGHDVLVLLANPDLAGPLKMHDWPVRVAEFNPHAWTDGVVIRGAAALALGAAGALRFLSRAFGEPDFLECQDYGGLAYFILQRQLVFEPGFPRVPVAVRVHAPAFALRRFTDEPRYALPGYWFDEMERFALEAAHVVLSPSPAMDRLLAAEGIAARPVRARNPARFAAPDAPARYDGGFVYIGRVSVLKGVDELLDAFARRAAAGDPHQLTLIGGDSPYAVRGTTMREHLERRHRSLVDAGLVDLRGPLPRQEAMSALDAATAVFLPSRFESFGYAVLEAMARRRVVVAGGGAPTDYVIDGRNGLLCDPEDPASVDRALDRAVRLTDADRAALGEAAAATAREVADPERAVDELLDALAATPGRARVPARFPVIRPRPQLPATEQPDQAVPGLLTVVIPCFNLGEYVTEALASVVASDHRPIEVVVIDDGSTEPATRAVVDGLTVGAEEGLTLRIVRTPNQGLARTRNLGAELARGEFLAFLDADDSVLPTYYSRCVEVLQAYPNVGLVGAWLDWDGPGHEWLTWNTEFPYLLVRNTINSAGVVHRRDVFRSHGLNNPRLITGLEDYDSVLRIAAAGWHGVAIPSKLFRYVSRPDSMTSGFNLANRRLMVERIADASPGLVDEYARDVLGLLNANGPGWAQSNPTLVYVPYVVPVGAVPADEADGADGAVGGGQLLGVEAAVS